MSDEAWAAAVARTGGRFYNAADEAAIVRAVSDIDRTAPGRVEMRRYSTEQPKIRLVRAGRGRGVDASRCAAADACRGSRRFRETSTMNHETSS